MEGGTSQKAFCQYCPGDEINFAAVSVERMSVGGVELTERRRAGELGHSGQRCEHDGVPEEALQVTEETSAISLL